MREVLSVERQAVPAARDKKSPSLATAPLPLMVRRLRSNRLEPRAHRLGTSGFLGEMLCPIALLICGLAAALLLVPAARAQDANSIAAAQKEGRSSGTRR